MIVAVTGATGYVGRFILKRLVEGGVKVRAWRRPSSDLEGLPDAVEWIEGDLDRPDSAAPLVAGAGMLVHAALDHRPGRYRGGEGDNLPRFRKLNIDGSLTLLDAARVAGVSRAVVLSSRAVFGEAATDLIDDDAPVAPDTEYGAAKVALEDFVRRAGEDGWPIAALRPTGAYGIVAPVARSKWYSLVSDAVNGAEIAPRSATEVHGHDVADAVWRLLHAETADIAGRMFNCSDIVVSHRDIVRLVQKIAGVSGPAPEDGSLPKGQMRSDRLQRLGLAFGGRALFEATVAGLVRAVMRERAAGR